MLTVKLTAVGCLLTTVLLLGPGYAAEATVTVHPKDTGVALVNPSMGWTMHFYSNRIENYGSKLAPSDTLEDFPGLSTVYLRVPWDGSPVLHFSSATFGFTPGKGVHEGDIFWEPDYGDPVFLEKLEGFLKAMAERYDGNDDALSKGITLRDDSILVQPPPQSWYDLFVSVGLRDGTPKIALPLDGGDGQRRHRLGSIDVTEK